MPVCLASRLFVFIYTVIQRQKVMYYNTISALGLTVACRRSRVKLSIYGFVADLKKHWILEQFGFWIFG